MNCKLKICLIYALNIFKDWFFMENKKFKIRKSKIKRTTKKGLAAFLAAAIGVSSGLALTMVNGRQVDASAALRRYFDDSSVNNQTRIMMDGNNFLKSGFWMQASMTAVAPATTPATYNAVLKFTIPGYDMNNLKFFVIDKNPLNGTVTKEYKASSSYASPTPTVYLPGLKQSSYDVHVYNGSLATENFVCKAEFSVTANTFANAAVQTNLLDGAGAPITISGTVQQLSYNKPEATNGANQVLLTLPSTVIPYSAQTIKVVFFATNRDGAPVNIDQTLYDYAMMSGSGANAALNYFPEANWGTAASTAYEAHFYKDEVKPGNFICKATNITLS
jgi:hypothetical protein